LESYQQALQAFRDAGDITDEKAVSRNIDQLNANRRDRALIEGPKFR